MTVTEYTPERAEALNHLNIPETELPVHVKVLWFDNIDSDASTIYADIHSHSFYEIHFVFSGEVTYEHKGDIIDLQEGKALFLPPNTLHRFKKCSKDFLKCSLAFKLEENTTNTAFLPTSGYKLFCFSDNITDHVNFILRQSVINDFFSPVLIGNRILEIIYSVCKSIEVQLPERPEAVADSRISVAKQYIKNNMHRLISCEDVARECCLSRKQLSRLFKKYTDKTLNDYLIDSRAEYAKKLVLQNEHSIKEISFMLGFKSECSFVSFFKVHFGFSPGIYRAKQMSDVTICPEQ